MKLTTAAYAAGMALRTTTVGSYPKPGYVPTPDWFRTGMDAAAPTVAYDRFLEHAPADLDEIHDRATAEVVSAQVVAGIDIPSDGEIRRENYIHYQCRNFSGIDFGRLTRRALRRGTWVAAVPTIVGPIRSGPPRLAADYRVAQAVTDRPVKMSLPGPLTILDSTADAHYGDEAAAGADLARALNVEVRTLAEAGCTWIQVDEPAFARRPGAALAHGVADLERCFAGVPDDVTTVVHVCCGYPKGLDLPDVDKADPGAYFQLAPALAASSVDAVSIEDAHRRNDLSLFDAWSHKTIILGAVDIATSIREDIAEIAARLAAVAERVGPDRLIAAPDCGLGMLSADLAQAKLRCLAAAARSVG